MMKKYFSGGLIRRLLPQITTALELEKLNKNLGSPIDHSKFMTRANYTASSNQKPGGFASKNIYKKIGGKG